MKISLSKRIVSFLLCLTVLLAGFAYKPQKAEAVAVTASVIASVAAIMTACGVTYWAASQDDAIQYIGGKIDEYFTSIVHPPESYEDWLGISATNQLFEVMSGGAMSFTSGVANKIIEFVRWFNEEEGVVSGGEPVGELGGLGSYAIETNNFNGDIQVSSSDDNDMKLITFTLTGVCASSSSHINKPRGIVFNDVASGRITAKLVSLSSFYPQDLYIGMANGLYNKNTNSIEAFIGSSNSMLATTSYYNLALGFRLPELPWSGSFTFMITGDAGEIIRPRTVAVTPSALVAAPSSLDDDESLVISPNVTLRQGMSVEDASNEILYTVTSEEGLTSETVDSALAGWDWLSNLLNSIKETVAGIAQSVLGIPQAIGQAASDVITGVGNAISTALYDAFVPSEAAIDAFVATLAANFDNHFSILSYPFSLLGRFVLEVVDAPGAHELVWPDIYEPFSGQRLIAAGSYNLDNALANENFRTAYDIYMTVIKGYIAFQFIAYLYAWFCDVFRMRNDDYANPIFEQEPIDDGPDDWDGYDSFFET